jgi:hypothetical protein
MAFISQLVKPKYSALDNEDSFHEREDLSGHGYCQVYSGKTNSRLLKSCIIPTQFWVLTTFLLLFVLGGIIVLEISIRDSLLRTLYGREFSTELSMSFKSS